MLLMGLLQFVMGACLCICRAKHVYGGVRPGQVELGPQRGLRPDGGIDDAWVGAGPGAPEIALGGPSPRRGRRRSRSRSRSRGRDRRGSNTGSEWSETGSAWTTDEENLFDYSSSDGEDLRRAEVVKRAAEERKQRKRHRRKQRRGREASRKPRKPDRRAPPPGVKGNRNV